MYMAANLCKNIKDSLEEQPIRKFYGWTDRSIRVPVETNHQNDKIFENFSL